MSSGIGKSSKPLVNSFTRVWLQEGGPRPDHPTEFLSSMKVAGLNQGFGSTNSIYIPDTSRYGQFIEAGSFKDGAERPTTSLMGHYAAYVRSKLLTLAQQGCEFDVQIHIGECEDPSIFNEFQKILIFEGVSVDTYSTEDLGALEPGDQGKVDETGEISMREMYEYVPLTFSLRSPAVVTNQLLDVIIPDSISCGDCEDESDGCQHFYAISSAAGGSPSTPADLVFSLDKGVTWAAHDIDGMNVANDPSALAKVGSYIVVVSNAEGGMFVALESEVIAGVDPAFNSVTTGFVAGGEPNDIWSTGRKAFIVGDFGYIYTTTDPTSGVTVIDAGEATIANLNAVHAISEEFAVAVGNGGSVIVIENDLASPATTSPVGVGTDLNCVWIFDENTWMIGDSNGDLWYTTDGGSTWTEKGLPGTAPSAITDISSPQDSIVYVAGTVSSHGRIYISVDGGYSFIIADRSTNLIPFSDEITAIASCPDDIDFILGVGLADDGSDGYIVIGSD
jgi:hypothetical protein